METGSYARNDSPAAAEPRTIGATLRDSAARWGDRLALREVDSGGAFGRSWTYAELLADSERLGRALASRHEPGARVAVYANNLPDGCCWSSPAPSPG